MASLKHIFLCLTSILFEAMLELSGAILTCDRTNRKPRIRGE